MHQEAIAELMKERDQVGIGDNVETLKLNLTPSNVIVCSRLRSRVCLNVLMFMGISLFSTNLNREMLTLVALLLYRPHHAAASHGE